MVGEHLRAYACMCVISMIFHDEVAERSYGALVLHVLLQMSFRIGSAPCRLHWTAGIRFSRKNDFFPWKKIIRFGYFTSFSDFSTYCPIAPRLCVPPQSHILLIWKMGFKTKSEQFFTSKNRIYFFSALFRIFFIIFRIFIFFRFFRFFRFPDFRENGKYFF